MQGACAAGDDDNGSDVAKQQRYLDFFKDLGDQYWGWQNESARRGRGFKGALKENFLPLREFSLRASLGPLVHALRLRLPSRPRILLSGHTSEGLPHPSCRFLYSFLDSHDCLAHTVKDLRFLAANPPPFCDDENCYYPMSFIRRGLDECPSIREDRDRDRLCSPFTHTHTHCTLTGLV